MLKAAPPVDLTLMRYEKNLMKAEVEAMRLVRQKTNVPTPDVLIYDTSRTLLPSDFFIMTYLPGVPFHKLRKELNLENQYKVEIQMGRMCRQIGEITNPAFGYWGQPEPVGTSWRDCFDHMIQGILLDAKDLDINLDKPYAEIYQTISRHFDALDEITTPRLVHWDIWEGNVFVDPQTLQVTGLIDFERAMWGDPLSESFLLSMNPNSGYLEGFGENILGTNNQVRRRMLYNAYLILILIIECYFRHYPTNDQENWARKAIQDVWKFLG